MPKLPIAFDTETHLIRPGLLAPPMVCLSTSNEHKVVHRKDPACKQIVAQLLACAAQGEIVLIGQNVAYDLGILANEWPEFVPMIFAALDADGVTDTMLRQKLIAISDNTLEWEHDAKGNATKSSYTLSSLAKRHKYPKELDKDTWRLRYAELDNVPVKDWPFEAFDYSLHDSLATLHVYNAQEERFDRLKDQYRQTRAAFALHLVSSYGLRTSPSMTAKHRRETQARLDKHRDDLLAGGLLVRDKNGSFKRKVKLAQERMERVWQESERIGMPLTEGGKPQLDSDAVELAGDALLIAFQEYGSSAKILQRVEELEAGHDLPLSTRFDTLLATGRTSSSKPNVQNRSVAPGDRECFVPRPGYVYVDGDYSGLELSTFAQVCHSWFGHSELARAIREGKDAHSLVAANILGISYDEAIRRKENPDDEDMYLARQVGKIENFGRAGGLGDRSLSIQARKKYKIERTINQCKESGAVWRATWPETTPYFNAITYIAENGGSIEQLFSERIRGGCSYTQAANTMFQGLGADATKDALYALVKETFLGTGALSTAKVVNFIHDEFMLEAPEELGHECAEEMAEIAVSVANRWLPDAPVKMKPLLTRRWSKLAKRIVVDGRLQPWEWSEAC
jgi:hypothetical protein